MVEFIIFFIPILITAIVLGGLEVIELHRRVEFLEEKLNKEEK